MREQNSVIKLSGDEAIIVLSEIEYILISLRDMARYYYEGHISVSEDKYIEYCKETTGFIDRNRITHRLSSVRRILSEKFDTSLGDDNMDDIERKMEEIKYWEKPGD